MRILQKMEHNYLQQNQFLLEGEKSQEQDYEWDN